LLGPERCALRLLAEHGRVVGGIRKTHRVHTRGQRGFRVSDTTDRALRTFRT
jgi:hypothetical protein